MKICISKKQFFLVLFTLSLGALTGAMFGIFGIDEMRTWFGETPTDSSIDTNASSINASSVDASSVDASSVGNDDEDSFVPIGPIIDAANGNGDSDPNACNGLLSNCDMKVNDLLWASVHNAMHVGSYFPNQSRELEEALTAGFRALQLDVCLCDDEVVFCHGSCGVGRRDPTEVFTNINNFLNDNPNEVLMFNFELSDGGNADRRPSSQDIWGMIAANEDFKKKVFRYQGGQWPTLQDMLDDNDQVLMFKHNGYYCWLQNQGTDLWTAGDCAARILEFHEFAVETPYGFSGYNAVLDSDVSCQGDRGSAAQDPFYKQDFYALNNFAKNFFKSPNKDASEALNSYDEFNRRNEECYAVMGLKPNIVNVDFWHLPKVDRGDIDGVLDIIYAVNEENAKRAA